jgi:uncharacterized membrane protein YeaQ/YmgE (transglycosylase-associated protein family)
LDKKAKTLLAKLMQSFGGAMILISLWLIPQHAPGSAEKIISILNCIIGALLILFGWYLSYKGRDNNDS